MSYTVLDLETSIRASFKRKGNPFDPENFVVMSGWKRKGGDVVGEYFGRAGAYGGAGLPKDWFTKLLRGTTILVGQSIKYDLLYALRDPDNLAAWMDWVADGGNLWDTQLAEYLLEGMDPASHMLSMDELAPRYGGTTKFDEVKTLWAAGISTEDIDPGLLRTYLCGSDTEHGDIGNTEVIFLGQLERARAAGQVKSTLLNMGSLLCSIEMERNGMAVDVELGRAQAGDLEKQIAELSIELATYLPDDLPFDFNWGSSIQKSAIIFGGKIKYQKRIHQADDSGNLLYAQKEEVHYLRHDGGTVSVQAMKDWDEDKGGLTDWSDLQTFKGGKNAGEFKTRKVKVNDPDKPKMKWEDFYYTFPGVTKPSIRWRSATPGVYSTAAEVIKELGNRGIPFLDALSRISGLTKDLTTYYIVTDPDTGESKGMLTLVQADGIIHHMLNHTSTVTARFSSSNPNLQNLPKEGKSVVKSLFVSRFKEGKIIQSDFTALEVYVQAIITGCKQLIADLIEGLDMHCVRVSQKEGITYEEALRLCKTEKLPEWDAKRTKAKVFSFQRAYGAGANTISEKAGIALEEVEALIVAEAERYPEIEPFYDKLGKTIKANSVPTNKWAAHPDIPGLQCQFRRSWWRTPDNKLYTWREQPSPEYLAKRGQATSFSPTEIKNYPVQGTGGEWAKAAMWLAIRAFYARRNFEGRGLLVNQVHDANYADAAPEVAFDVAVTLHACMDEASTFMEWYFDWPIPVAVPTETGWGANMMDEQRMPEGFTSAVADQRRFLRTRYLNNYTPSFERPTALAA